MVSKLFRAHGVFCAEHPWEVIVATLTLTVCMITVEQQNSAPPPRPALRHCVGCLQEAEYNAADVIVMTLIRCLAILYSYYQFCTLQRLGSKYILGIAGLFTVFSSFVFTSTVLNFLRIDLSDLKDALFFFILLIDLSKAAVLAQFALNGSNPKEIRKNIAKGMAILGPTITLDTIVETLLIGVGTLSGVHRLEILSYFACFSVLVNYIIFMTVYPACLSLILELSSSTDIYGKKQSLMCTLKEKSNPVVERVKLIMSVGLIFVHILSRWPFRDADDNNMRPLVIEQYVNMNRTEEAGIPGYIMKWMVLSADHTAILILLLALVVKFIFFENREDLAEQLRAHSETVQRKIATVDNNNTPSNMPFLKSHTFYIEGKIPFKSASDMEFEDKQIQTDSVESLPLEDDIKICRDLEDCLKIYNDSESGATALTDDEVILLVRNKQIAAHQIEKAVDDAERGVLIRRKILAADANLTTTLSDLPYKNYHYEKVMGACCENVIGFMQLPVGFAGPLNLNGKKLYVPMATTEGCLVASTNRGCRALCQLGVCSKVFGDGMTRAPSVRFPSISRAIEAKKWMEIAENFSQIKREFDSTSRYARLIKIKIMIGGRLLFIRFVATTGDAMGMNMLSKGTEICLKFVQEKFPDMEIVSLSGNCCSDKKPAAINWIEGRGKSVVAEAIVPANIVKSVLKTSTSSLVEVNHSKNLVGSSLAGSIGGFNAHAANIVTAIFIATGQDPAQNVASSNCITIMETWGDTGEDLYISCTMPSMEVGTVGGGTILPPQKSCLAMLGVQGPHPDCPGENANQLAKIICATVLAGELSLMSALAAGHLVKSHLRHNRSTTTVPFPFFPPCKESA